MSLPRYHNLTDVYDSIWKLLSRAANDKHHPAHFCTISTVDHGLPRARMVVLRKAVREANQLYCYTDIRSDKMTELAAGSALHWLLWDSKNRVQLRVLTTPEVERQTDYTRNIWANLPLAGKLSYLTEQAPGTPRAEYTDSLPHHIEQREATDETPEELPDEHFCVLKGHIEEIEWLYLHPDGHQRARFKVGEELEHTWLIP